MWGTNIENIQTLYTTKALQLTHNIVIAMSSNHLNIERQMIFSPLPISFYAKKLSTSHLVKVLYS